MANSIPREAFDRSLLNNDKSHHRKKSEETLCHRLLLFYNFLLATNYLFTACITITEKSNDVFVWIEKKMMVVLPSYMKNILKCCGYDNCHTIATIEDADVEYFTDEVRKGSVKKFFHAKISAEGIMEGCATSVENFVFIRGHVRLLQTIVKCVKETLEIHGAGGFSLKLPKVSSKEHEGENISSEVVSVYRKRFKFSPVLSTSAQEGNEALLEASTDDTKSAIKKARSDLTRKAIMILITRTPILFAKVGIYFDCN